MARQDEIWREVTEVFRGLFDDESLQIDPTTTAGDVPGWDSVTHIQLLVLLERRFAIRFNTGEIAGLGNVGEMVALIDRRSAPGP